MTQKKDEDTVVIHVRIPLSIKTEVERMTVEESRPSMNNMFLKLILEAIQTREMLK